MAALQPTSSGWAEEDDSIPGRIALAEEQVHKLQEELSTVLAGLADLKEQVQNAEDMKGDQQSDRLRREISDVLKTQASALEEMVRSTQGFPRRWARLELNTSQRKSLMLTIKARRAREQIA
eukprot:CAMPEP_0197655042 /NCGR_PEP_ID=MMETSP1338-20131121/39214_1 /TAXON_ID=43686 ORGANISM="Pelagodinium beii, Strain RCC1491" /NCGR_SAMPLE_ID=MMETSP1338 /ASSEMBLY_ACC=CAM_ASM_000754 /LENGTH=121 /DNA_ID=CAMNT_0043230611 /DNA_START=32 /DNA_END=397 /DNA_ORIENTATION=+